MITTPVPPTTPFTVTLEAQQWNGVLAALNEAAYRVAAPLIGAISEQIQAQAQAQAQPPAAGKPPPNGRDERSEDRPE